MLLSNAAGNHTQDVSGVSILLLDQLNYIFDLVLSQEGLS